MNRGIAPSRPSLLKRIDGRLRRLYEDVQRSAGPRLAILRSGCRYYLPHTQKAHGLGRELVVSLTSYPPRFGTLALTLRCLLSQTVKPDRVILWVAQADEQLLPRNVNSLRRHGLEIRTTEDIGPYKKIIPALLAFPEAIIVTVDDDIYFEADWLEALVSAWDGTPSQIVCHRAHRVVLGEDGLPRPYAEWMSGAAPSPQAANLFPTAGRGVLFPPRTLAPEVTAKDKFLRLCPNADDLWLYWMGRRAGATYKLVKPNRQMINWPGSQEVALYADNRLPSGNDQKIRNLIDEFGFPGVG